MFAETQIEKEQIVLVNKLSHIDTVSDVPVFQITELGVSSFIKLNGALTNIARYDFT